MGVERDGTPMNRLPMCFAAALAAVIYNPPEAAAQKSTAEKIYADLATLPAAQRDKRIEDGARAEGKLVIIHTMRGNLSTDHLELLDSAGIDILIAVAYGRMLRSVPLKDGRIAPNHDSAVAAFRRTERAVVGEG